MGHLQARFQSHNAELLQKCNGHQHSLDSKVKNHTVSQNPKKCQQSQISHMWGPFVAPTLPPDYGKSEVISRGSPPQSVNKRNTGTTTCRVIKSNTGHKNIVLQPFTVLLSFCFLQCSAICKQTHNLSFHPPKHVCK